MQDVHSRGKPYYLFNSLNASTTNSSLVISILLNILITVAQVVGGLVSDSLSLLSDAMHNFSDVLALLINYIIDRLTKRKITRSRLSGASEPSYRCFDHGCQPDRYFRDASQRSYNQIQQTNRDRFDLGDRAGRSEYPGEWRKRSFAEK